MSAHYETLETRLPAERGEATEPTIRTVCKMGGKVIDECASTPR